MTSHHPTLTALGLRPASPDERGWYVFVLIDGASRRVWATDAPDDAVTRARRGARLEAGTTHVVW